MTDRDRDFDVVVWGATGFTGRLVAEYLLARYGAGGTLRCLVAMSDRFPVHSRSQKSASAKPGSAAALDGGEP